MSYEASTEFGPFLGDRAMPNGEEIKGLRGELVELGKKKRGHYPRSSISLCPS